MNGQKGHAMRPLRIDTNGASEYRLSGADPFAPTPNTTNVFEDSLSYSLSIPSPATPGTQIGVPVEYLMGLIEKSKTLEAETDNLRGMIKDLNIKVEEEKSKNRSQLMQHNSTSTLFSYSPGTPSTRGLSNNFSNGSRTLPWGIITPRQSDEVLPARASFTGNPVTPTTPRTPYKITQPPSGRGTSNSVRGSHKRTQTPTQSAVRRAMSGQPVHTKGIERQEDRGLLSDFFDAIKAWANQWVLQSGTLTPEEIMDFMEANSAVSVFLGTGKVIDATLIATEESMRAEFAAAMVGNDITMNTLCDSFLFQADLPEQVDLIQLYNAYIALGPGTEVMKHELLLKQELLYTLIKNDPGHRKWRVEMAKSHAETMIDKLHVILRELSTTSHADIADRNHSLQELYIKGYRIGFRMRMEAAKWQMSWPSVGDDFNPELMVNESRMIHGGIMKTLIRVEQSPGSYKIRFAMTPTMIKSVFASGVEQKQIVHKGLVHLERKPSYIGSERDFFVGNSVPANLSPTSPAATNGRIPPANGRAFHY